MAKKCKLCKQNIKNIDYKDTELLKNYLNSLCQIMPKHQTKLCAKHQRMIAKAIKISRINGLLPFIPR